MAYLDARLPVKISQGTSSGARFQTDIVTYGNGKEYVNSRWAYQRSVFNLAYIVKDRAEAIEVYDFWLAARGRFHTFRVKDYLDYTSGANGAGDPVNTDQVIGTGNGVLTTFQITKTYTAGGISYVRKLTKPITGTVTVAIDGVDEPNFTVDNNTGIITFTLGAPAAGEVITAGYEFDVHCRFDQDDLEGIQYVIIRPDSSRDNFSFSSLNAIEVLE